MFLLWGKKSLQIIFSKTGPGVFIALSEKTPSLLGKVECYLFGGERRQRKQVNIRLFIPATSGSGSIPGRGIQTTSQKFSFWAWTEAVWQSWTQMTTVLLARIQAPSAWWSYVNFYQHPYIGLSTVLSNIGCCIRQSTGTIYSRKKIFFSVK